MAPALVWDHRLFVAVGGREHQKATLKLQELGLVVSQSPSTFSGVVVGAALLEKNADQNRCRRWVGGWMDGWMCVSKRSGAISPYVLCRGAETSLLQVEAFVDAASLHHKAPPPRTVCRQ